MSCQGWMRKEAQGTKVHASRNELVVIAVVLALDVATGRLRSLTGSQQSSMLCLPFVEGIPSNMFLKTHLTTNKRLERDALDYSALPAHRYRVSSSDPQVCYVSLPIETRRRLDH